MTCPVHDPVVHVDADENYVKTTCRVCGAGLDDLLAEVELTPVASLVDSPETDATETAPDTADTGTDEAASAIAAGYDPFDIEGVEGLFVHENIITTEDELYGQTPAAD